MVADKVDEKTKKNSVLHSAVENTLATFQVMRIFHLGIMLTDDAGIIDELKEFVEELDAAALDQIKGFDLPRFRRLTEDPKFDDADELLNEFAWECDHKGLLGFLCEARCPQVEVLKGKGTKQLTWGIQHIAWFYGEDLSDVIQQADAWAKSQEKEVETLRRLSLDDEDDD